MAKRRNPPTESTRAAQPRLCKPRDECRDLLQRQIAKGEELHDRPIQSELDLDAARKERSRWIDYTDQLLQTLFDTDDPAKEFTHTGPSIAFWSSDLLWKVRNFREDMASSIYRIRSILERTELFDIAGEAPQAASTLNVTDVFVVHGHDTAALESAARFLEKLGLRAIILHERASGGKTIVEKIEAHSDVGFAVVLLTPDDVGAVATMPTSLQPRARQNVILELGYFIGRLGRDRVCALQRGDLALPSDVVGVVYVPMDADGAWKLLLAREMKAAGLPVDLNRAM
jgi:predicted nucleotide-binding protein